MYEFEYRYNENCVFAHEVWQRYKDEPKGKWFKVGQFLTAPYAKDFRDLCTRLSNL